jgi:hypothetical protein
VQACKSLCHFRAVPYRFGHPRLVIDDLSAEHWITSTLCEYKSRKLYAALDESLLVNGCFAEKYRAFLLTFVLCAVFHVQIYDYDTGDRLETLSNIHDLTISAMCFFPPLQFTITASRDGTSK